MILYIYLLFEFGYYLYCHIFIYRALNNRCYTRNRRGLSKQLSGEINTHLKEYFTNEEDLTKYLTDSFPNRDLITIENIRKVLSYHIHNTHPNKDDIMCDDGVNEIVDIIKSRADSLICPDGCRTNNRNISYHFMTNKLQYIHKPFAFYTFAYFVRRAFNFYMYTLGFTNIIDPQLNLRVWIRENNGATNKMPLVFIHGVGCGIIPYINKIQRLSVDRRTVIVPELPNISYDLYKFPPPSNDELVTSLYNTLSKLDIQLVDLIGHSYGSLILNIFQNKYPHMCNYKTYAEPACFYIQQTHLSSTILFKTSFNNITNFLRTIIIYKDIYIQYIFKRTIFYEHTLITNLDDKTNIILSKDDEIMPSYYIHKYITTHYPQVHVEMIDGVHGAYCST